MKGGIKACGKLYFFFAVSTQCSFFVTGTVRGLSSSFQSGSNSSSAFGSTTAPERMCAPTSEPFSRMQTLSSRPASFASCFRRIAAASPAGPAPTITTS